MKNKIILHLGPHGWNITYCGPHSEKIAEVFDTKTLPTAFTAHAPMEKVKAEIQRSHPDVLVQHFSEA